MIPGYWRDQVCSRDIHAVAYRLGRVRETIQGRPFRELARLGIVQAPVGIPGVTIMPYFKTQPRGLRLRAQGLRRRLGTVGLRLACLGTQKLDHSAAR